MIGALFACLQARPKMWRNLFFAALVLLLALNFVVRPEEAHFGWDAIPGFFAAFGLVVGLAVLFIMEKIISPLIARKDDFYGDI